MSIVLIESSAPHSRTSRATDSSCCCGCVGADGAAGGSEVKPSSPILSCAISCRQSSVLSPGPPNAFLNCSSVFCTSDMEPCAAGRREMVDGKDRAHRRPPLTLHHVSLGFVGVTGWRGASTSELTMMLPKTPKAPSCRRQTPQKRINKIREARVGVLLLGALGLLVRHRNVAEPLVRLGTRQLASRRRRPARAAASLLACLRSREAHSGQSIKAMSRRGLGELAGWI